MTAMRQYFDRTLLPAFAARFTPSDLVLNIGAGKHSYREWFTCRLVTADIDSAAGCDLTFPAEQIQFGDDQVAGVLLMGVFERLDDPMQAMREILRVLRPAGVALVSALDLSVPWRKPCDRWRLSPGGVEHIAHGFTVLQSEHVEGGHFMVLQKPEGV